MTEPPADATQLAGHNGAARESQLDWPEANQRYLCALLVLMQSTFEGALPPSGTIAQAEAQRALHEAERALPAPSALAVLSAAFGLSSFERQIVLMCAGVELDAKFAACCARLGGQTAPSFGFALARLPDAHWSALSPARPLRHFRLLELDNTHALSTSALRLDERVLHYLLGVHYLDPAVTSIAEVLHAQPHKLAPSQSALAEQIVARWQVVERGAAVPVIRLLGADGASKRAVARAACEAVGLGLFAVAAHSIGTGVDELVLSRLLAREATLAGMGLLVDCDDLDPGDGSRALAVDRLVTRAIGPCFVTNSERRNPLKRPVVNFDVRGPLPSEQHALWQHALRAGAPELVTQNVDRIVAQFDLSAAAIEACAVSLQSSALQGEQQLWDVCRAHVRPQLEELTQRIEPTSSWEDLILPEAQREVLQEIGVHMRQRAKVYGAWGFGKSSRGLGVAALFAGPSGTGKTLAAEVLAQTLRLDLYKVDLSRVVSKYLGETEANLRRVFDAADQGAAILLFDEADALFGKRSEVKDSHDRHANVEVSYLLQRMETSRGLVILTTNMKSALDVAFMRRLRFIVQFPFPDVAHRKAIWQRMFPAATPVEELDWDKLARLNLAGGHIKNIALHAAFLAAEAGSAVRMSHLLRAARSEYAKLERPITLSELEG